MSVEVSVITVDPGESAGRARALAAAAGRWVTFLRAGERLLPEWLDAVRSEGDVVYGDSMVLDSDATESTRRLLRPGWSPELLLGFPYLGSGTAIRRDLAVAVGLRAELGDADVQDFWLRAVERTAAIRHVPKVLCAEIDPAGAVSSAAPEAIRQALERRATPGSVEPLAGSPGLFRIRRRFRPGLVSIIVPTRDRLDLLRPCIESIERHSSVPYEILIVDNQSRDPATLRYLEATPATVLRYPQEFNFAALNDFAAESARGEYLLFLNNDTEVRRPGWLEALLEYAALPEVGAVGAKLHHADGTIQHAGVVVHPGPRIDHVASGQREPDLAHAYFPKVACEVAAVTAACVMMRRDVFRRVGGFDPSLRVAYNDIDLCFRLRALGYSIVFTPFCEVTHYSCATRPPTVPLADAVLFRARWGGTAFDEDPYLVPVCRALGYEVAIPSGIHTISELDEYSGATTAGRLPNGT